MRVFRGISDIFGRWLLLPSLIMLVGLAVSPSLQAQQHALGANPESTQPPAQAGQTPPSATPCNFHPIDEDELPEFFRGVKSANLAIIFQPDLRKALECHGHEKECAESETAQDHAPWTLRPGAKEKHAQFMFKVFTTLNDGYPQELYPENLTNLFRPMIKQLFAPVLPRDSSCEIPEPTMINPNSSKAAYASTSGSPDVVTFMIEVTLIKKTKPHIVILTTNRWRKGDAIYFHPLPYSTAFPLDQPEAEFKKQFAEFVAGFKQGLDPTLAPEE